MKRVLTAAAAAAGIVLLTAGAASAGVIAPSAGDPTVTFTNPASSTATISTSPIDLSGEVSRPGGNVDAVQVIVSWADTVKGRPKVPHPTVGTTNIVPPGQSSFEWGYPGVLGSNGQYAVKIIATTDNGAGQQEQTTATSGFVLNVAPAAPTDLVDHVDLATRTASLTWSPNSEADLIGYDVFRSGPTSDAPYELLNGVLAPGTTYTDKDVASLPKGTYRYEVEALRPSGDGTKLIPSAPSIEADAQFPNPPLPGAKPSNTSANAANGQTVTSTPGADVITNGAPAGVTSDNPSVVLPGSAGDIPGYQQLLQQAQVPANASSGGDNPAVEDGSQGSGYAPTLPYKPLTGQQAAPAPAPTQTVPLGPNEGGASNGHQTIEFIAGALLLAVLAMFALLLKRSLDQPVALEPIAPGADDALLLTILSPVAATLPPAEEEEPFDLDVFNADVMKLFDSDTEYTDDLGIDEEERWGALFDWNDREPEDLDGVKVAPDPEPVAFVVPTPAEPPPAPSGSKAARSLRPLRSAWRT